MDNAEDTEVVATTTPAIAEALQVFTNKVLDLYTAAGATDMTGVKAPMKALLIDIAGATADGFQFGDVPVLLASVVEKLAGIAEGGITGGANKKAFVVSAAALAYEILDKGVDGDLNRIDIPYLPNLVEVQVEKYGVPFLLSILVEGVVAGYNKVKKQA